MERVAKRPGAGGRPRSGLILLLVFGLLAPTAGCDRESPTDFEGDGIHLFSSQPRGMVQIGSDRELDRLPRDPFRLLSVGVVNDDLVVRVRYRGCMPHPFHLVALDRFQFVPRSVHSPFVLPPPHLTLVLAHDSRGDLCRDFFHEELHFDLSVIRSHYQRTFGFETGEVVLVLRGIRVLYAF